MNPAECIYKRRWLPRPASVTSKSSRPTSDLSIQGNGMPAPVFGQSARTTDDDAKRTGKVECGVKGAVPIGGSGGSGGRSASILQGWVGIEGCVCQGGYREHLVSWSVTVQDFARIRFSIHISLTILLCIRSTPTIQMAAYKNIALVGVCNPTLSRE